MLSLVASLRCFLKIKEDKIHLVTTNQVALSF